MASTAIDEASVLARFDELVRDGVVMYAEDMEKVYYEDRGFKFEFRITSALKSKPAAVGDNAELDDANGGADGGSHHTSSETKAPGTGNGSAGASSSNGTLHGIEFDADGCLPGGDISIAGYEIGLVGGGAHVLSFNKFCAYRPHLMLVTADGRRRQFEALDGADLGAAREVLMGLHRRGGGGGGGGGVGQEYLAIFNCGKKGGCSRLHKHMQVIPAPDAIPLWPDEAKPEGSSGGQPGPPFRYFVHRFGGSLNGGGGGAGELPSADELVGAYQQMLGQAAALVPGREEAMEESGDGGGGGREAAVPHNVVLGGRWMVVIPRVTDGVDGIGVNAAGMLGVVWAAGTETVDKWKRLGPRRVLGEVGVRG
ncbi:ATP adenylyltransferase [Colletotrichum navitas]|uniref:ATP adenylyltransferase n=1 Tax=Colletotrichum navitas TaxID=681940 RepID=A0AAD8PZ27_9PEZI|nr:ATP adenylyltransferase [Colletotrichum navitas]KAK1590758.1 ATP adenylyltransferase [Colletotrichum navitas]